VDKLKDDCGIWLDTQQENDEKFVSDYTTRYRASQGDNRNLEDIKLSSCVTHSDNMTLIKIPAMEEVIQAYFP